MGLPCAICGRPIDYSLPAGDPWSYELDEITPYKLLGRGCELDPNNVQPAHRICNERKGAKLFYVAPEQEEEQQQNMDVKPSQNWSA